MSIFKKIQIKFISLKENLIALFLYTLVTYKYPYYIKTKLKYKKQINYITSPRRVHIRLLSHLRFSNGNALKFLKSCLKDLLYSYNRLYISYYKKRNIDTDEVYIKQLAFIRKVSKLLN